MNISAGGEPAPSIQYDTVSVHFGPVEAVHAVSLSVDSGELFGIVGSDGAGKSSLLRTAATLVPPSSGSVRVHGVDVMSHRSKIKTMIGYMPQGFGLYHDLTVRETMEFFLDIYGILGPERQKRMTRYLDFSNLLPFLDRLAGNLSGGMKQKLGLACVLVHEPAVLILDEPTNGVDPISRQEFWDMLIQMRNKGMTILISTAYLDEGEQCDRLALMHRGQVLISGTPLQIRASSPSLEEAVIQRIKEVDHGLDDETFSWGGTPGA
ncbi:MAG TPA: ABC transporter ATP-binding protein [Thermodesulfobacteriota bacterium]|nr:ABC transporter ATP-binding protein [Thermodesulfobacteriota bacterium]